MAATLTSVHTSGTTATLTLNPDAPLFVPASYLAAEDFSPEWWCLVHTCPSFRDYWLQDYCSTDPERCPSHKGPDPGLYPGFADTEVDMDLPLELNQLQCGLENTPPLCSEDTENVDLNYLKPKKEKKTGGAGRYPCLSSSWKSLPANGAMKVRSWRKSEALRSKMIHQPR